MANGWRKLTGGAPWPRGEGAYPIEAYSEFMPPPLVGIKPYAHAQVDSLLFDAADPVGWHVTEYEEAFELRPGMEQVASQIVRALVHLGRGESSHGLSRHKLTDNKAWPEELAEKAPRLKHERYVTLAPLALSRTQDDKGRIRWTLFGGSEQGPGRAFWKSFAEDAGPGEARSRGVAFLASLLRTVYGEEVETEAGLRRAGLRILPQEGDPPLPHWKEEATPGWTTPFLYTGKRAIRSTKYLLTFTAFADLPAEVRQAYFEGELHLLPCPASLLFWGAAGYHRLHQHHPFAAQLPLLHSVSRHEDPYGLRVPQSGWTHTGEGRSVHGQGPVRNTFRRTHRWAKILRDEDELSLEGEDEKLLHVLFSTIPDDLGLYGKPMARNAEIWSDQFEIVLDGPRASPDQIKRALRTLEAGGLFGYRFQYPPMRVGRHMVYWHRPLAAYHSPKENRPKLLPGAPLGYLTAYAAAEPNLEQSVALWPRLLQRREHVEALRLFERAADKRPRETVVDLRKVFDARRMSAGAPLHESFARQLLTRAHHHPSFSDWLEKLPKKVEDAEAAKTFLDEVHQSVAADPTLPEPLTLKWSGRRTYEVAYWKAISRLSEGRFLNKNNADCCRDRHTQLTLSYPEKQLDQVAEFLLDYYRQWTNRAGVDREVLVGDMPFTWKTDFDYSWSEGWRANADGAAVERDLFVVIPGRDRTRAVILGDHYDTAYKYDVYEGRRGKKGAMIAACGADDNGSATATLMLAAPILMELSKAGKLRCDVWLVHLTGEEFPADCLGARNLAQRLVEGSLSLRTADGKRRDLSSVRLQGAFIMDMIAHNNEHEPDVFQIAPGSGAESFWLAYQAHIANEQWNRWARKRNDGPSRRSLQRGRRSPHGAAVPETALHLPLSGEVRLAFDPRSTLYNTDAQIFSDAGLPIVLMMENYDINREGYHDVHDTMANIDLDYGAALSAISIEAVARAASEPSPF